MDAKTESDLVSKLQLFNENYERMEELYDKLIVLDYSKLISSKYKLRPIHKYYFSTMTNTGEQFYTFACLSAWLIKDKCNIQLKNDINPEEYDDPNVYIYSILDALRSVGKAIDISPNKLKQGYGSEVIYILNCFADKAIESVKFPNEAQINIVNNNFDLANFDGQDQNEYVDDDDEEDAKYLFENQQYTLIDDDEDTLSIENVSDDSDDQNKANSLKSAKRNKSSLVKTELNKSATSFRPQSYKPIMKATIDSKEWNDEYERMLPQLRLSNRILEENGNNWRIRFDELKKRNSLINTELNQCNDGLTRLELDVQKSLDRLESRERYVQQQMDALCNELLAYRSELTRSMENYQKINGGVVSKLRRLAELSETIQKVKADTEKREQSIVDKTPLLSIRKALAHLKLEINKLNIQIGVALRNVLHHKLQKTIQKNEQNLINSNYNQDAFGLFANANNNQELRFVY